MSKARHFDRDHAYSIPCTPVVADGATEFEQVLNAVAATEQQALAALLMPNTPEAKTLKRRLKIRLRREGFHFNNYIPTAFLKALGWEKEVERRFSVELLGGRPRKPKRKAKKTPAQPVERATA